MLSLFSNFRKRDEKEQKRLKKNVFEHLEYDKKNNKELENINLNNLNIEYIGDFISKKSLSSLRGYSGFIQNDTKTKEKLDNYIIEHSIS